MYKKNTAGIPPPPYYLVCVKPWFNYEKNSYDYF